MALRRVHYHATLPPQVGGPAEFIPVTFASAVGAPGAAETALKAGKSPAEAQAAATTATTGMFPGAEGNCPEGSTTLWCFKCRKPFCASTKFTACPACDIEQVVPAPADKEGPRC